MIDQRELDKALKNLNDGKFSFRMVGCITETVQKQKEEIEELRQFRESATLKLAEQDVKISRLEKDLTTANAKIFALIKSNAIVEGSIDATKRGIMTFRDVAVPKMLVALQDAGRHLLEAFNLAKEASSKAIDAGEPVVREWWSSTEPRRKELLERLHKMSLEFSKKIQ